MALERLAARARATGRLALDTEFVSERRYRPLLCLVQIAVEGERGTEIEVVDALADAEPAPVAALLEDPAVEVVVHAGYQDVALLRRVWRVEVRNIFDTQVAAAFTGTSAQPGYDALLADVLGIPASRSASFTRWDRRPLTQEQLDYARRDVDHLLELAAALRARLERRGRLEWAREECRRLEQASDERDPDELLRKLPRVASLGGRGAAVARELVLWREQAAEAEDRAPRSLLGDPALVEIARRRPSSVPQLGDIRGVPEVTLRRRGRAILEVVARGEAAPALRLDFERGEIPPDHAAPLVALADALVRQRALEQELATQLVAGRPELTEVVVAVLNGAPEPDVRPLHGWRRELVGAELLELLHGRRSLAVGSDGRLRSDPLEASRRDAGDG